MKKLLNNPVFIGMILVLIFVLIFSNSKKIRNGFRPSVKSLDEIIAARLASIESLPEDSEWRESIQQLANENSISFREAALNSISFLLTSARENGVRLYSDAEIRDSIKKTYDYIVLA